MCKVTFILFIVGCSLAKLPDYIKTCSRNSPDFNKCATVHGKRAIPYVLKGDRTFKIPPLIPLSIPRIEFEVGQGLTIKVNDVNVYGLDTVDLHEIGFDFDKQKVFTTLYFDRLTILGEYEVDGTILFHLQGRGPCNITIENVKVDYELNYDVVQKHGKDYIDIKSDRLNLDTKNEYYKLDNLFGNEQISEATNRLLNENASDITKELKGPITAVVKAIIKDMVQNYMTAVPMEEIFPSN